MTQDHSDRTDPDGAATGVQPGGDPDDTAEQSTPGSDGDGPEAGYEPPADEQTSPGTTSADGR